MTRKENKNNELHYNASVKISWCMNLKRKQHMFWYTCLETNHHKKAVTMLSLSSKVKRTSKRQKWQSSQIVEDILITQYYRFRTQATVAKEITQKYQRRRKCQFSQSRTSFNKNNAFCQYHYLFLNTRIQNKHTTRNCK